MHDKISTPTGTPVPDKNVNEISSRESFEGGYGDEYDREELSRIVKYNTRTRTWQQDWGRLFQGRASHGCTFVDGKVIVAGGYRIEDDIYLRSTEIVDVDSRQTRPASNMVVSRNGAALVNANGRVLAIGGITDDKNPKSLKSVEEFDLERETWSLAPFSLDQHRSSMSYLVVPEHKICP